MKFLPTSEADRTEMLRAIGVSSVNDLFASIPREVRKGPDLPPPMSEIEPDMLVSDLVTSSLSQPGAAWLNSLIRAVI